MLIDRPQDDARDCYDGDHVQTAVVKWPHNAHLRCEKCGAKEWPMDLPLVLMLGLPHVTAAIYADRVTEWVANMTIFGQ